MTFLRRACAIIVVLWLVPASSCKPTAATPGDGGGLPPPGRCFGKAVSCRSDGDCGGGGFTKCQEGMCCSGTVDPSDCSCHCAGGPACKGGELCCPGACEGTKDPGVLRCRPHRECYPCEF